MSHSERLKKLKTIVRLSCYIMVGIGIFSMLLQQNIALGLGGAFLSISASIPLIALGSFQDRILSLVNLIVSLVYVAHLVS